ncbi:MAG: XdhC family protein, partial [Chloroflexota bacterium]
MQDQALVKPMGQWLQAGKRVALATVTETWGSSPRRVGAKLAVTEDMQIIGSVSAGCVDSAVIESALEVIKTGQSRTLRYDVGDDLTLSNGLACGGQLQVFVQP